MTKDSRADHAPRGRDRGDETPPVDSFEQGQPIDGEAETSLEPADGFGERPGADVYEQSQGVEDQQRVIRGERREDVEEADWLEQSIEEPLDEGRR
jgi:hypothetical protein